MCFITESSEDKSHTFLCPILWLWESLYFFRPCPLDILRSALINTICLALAKYKKFLSLNKLFPPRPCIPDLSLSECCKLSHKPLKIEVCNGNVERSLVVLIQHTQYWCELMILCAVATLVKPSLPLGFRV